MPVFTTHRLYCDACKISVNMLEWSDKLPSKCRCGGPYIDADTRKRVGLTQKEEIEAEIAEMNDAQEIT